MAEQLTQMNLTNKQEFKIYVGDLDENCNDTILLKQFEKFGAIRAQVTKAKRKRFIGDNAERFYGIVYFNSFEEIERAKNEMDQQVIVNNRIRVCIYKSYFDRINSDVYIKNIEHLTIQQIKQNFQKFGQVFSIKIAQDKSGNHLNYGYLSFVDKEARDNCLNMCAAGFIINNQKVEVAGFTPYNKRDRLQTNIYVKNLPYYPDQKEFELDSIKTILHNEASKHGKVSSLMVKFDEKHKKYFAFVCYENKADAKKAYQELAKLKISDSQLEVNWAQKKEERQQLTLYNLKSNIKKTNIFLKNLLEDVDENKIKEVFSQFGTITSVCVKAPTNVPTHVTTKTNFGFINYQTEQMAQIAMNAVKSEEHGLQIKNLFLNNESVVLLFKPKDQMKNLKNNKNLPNTQNIMQMMQQMSGNPMLFYQAMQQMMIMNMNMMMNKNQNRMQMPFMNFNMMMPNKNQMPMTMNMNMPFPQNNMQQFRNVGQMPMQMGMPMPQMQNINNVNLIAKPQQQVTSKMNAQSLKENLNDFLKQDQDKQRALLGELLFPLVSKFSSVKEQAPKITGMLIDFEVFEVSEILEFLENEELLKERVKEAEELIESTDNQQ